MRFLASKLFLGLIGLLFVVSAQATTIGTAPQFTGNVTTTPFVDGENIDSSISRDFNFLAGSEVSDLGGDTFNYLGSVSGSLLDASGNTVDDGWTFTWDVDANADPFIDSEFTIVNQTSSDQTFDITFTLPINPAFSPAISLGEFAFIAEDTSGDTFSGATLPGSDGVSFTLNNWAGLIDGSTELLLTALVIPCTGAGCEIVFGNITATEMESGVMTSIGLNLNFTLSAGDTVTIDTRFEVTPVPVPAAFWLFGTSLIGLVSWTRRRQIAV